MKPASEWHRPQTWVICGREILPMKPLRGSIASMPVVPAVTPVAVDAAEAFRLVDVPVEVPGRDGQPLVPGLEVTGGACVRGLGPRRGRPQHDRKEQRSRETESRSSSSGDHRAFCAWLADWSIAMRSAISRDVKTGQSRFCPATVGVTSAWFHRAASAAAGESSPFTFAKSLAGLPRSPRSTWQCKQPFWLATLYPCCTLPLAK